MRWVRRGRHWASGRRRSPPSRRRCGAIPKTRYPCRSRAGLAAAERPEAVLRACAEAEALGGVVAVPLARVLGDMCRDDDAVEVLRAAVERQRSFESLAALSLAEAALREADAARWAFGAAMLTPAARQRPNARAGCAGPWRRRLMDAGEVEAAIGFLTAEAGGEPGSCGLSDPTWAGAADGGRHRRRGGRTCAAPRNWLRRSRGLPRLCQRPEDRRRRSDRRRLAAQLARPDLPAPRGAS
jgi:hypothetical protein